LRTFKLTPIKINILAKLEQGKYEAEIAKELNVSRSAVNQNIKKFVSMGWVKPEFRDLIKFYILTNEGHQLLARRVSDSLTNPELPEQTIRHHAYVLKAELLNKLAADEPALVLMKAGVSFGPAGLKNQASAYLRWEEKQALLTPTNLIIYVSQIETTLNESPIVTTFNATTKAREFAEGLEAQLRKTKPNFKLKRLDDGTIKMEVIEHHIALTNNPIAKDVLEKRAKLMLYDDADGLARVGVDNSKGVPELEAFHKKYAPEDIQKLSGFIKAVYTGQFDYQKEQEARLDLAAKLDFFATNINTHVQWMYESLKANQQGRRMPRKPKDRDEEQQKQKRL
jgi:DNA-binding MarR family transcriptional regulator